MIKAVRNIINSWFLPHVDGDYINTRLYPAIQLHGISVGDHSISFRDYDPMDEYRHPLKDSHSTENHIKFEDIAIINERGAFWEILLWNGYMYALSKNCSAKHLYNTYRNVRKMSYFSLRRPVSPQEMSKNMEI